MLRESMGAYYHFAALAIFVALGGGSTAAYLVCKGWNDVKSGKEEADLEQIAKEKEEKGSVEVQQTACNQTLETFKTFLKDVMNVDQEVIDSKATFNTTTCKGSLGSGLDWTFNVQNSTWD